MNYMVHVDTPTHHYSSHKVGGVQEARDDAAQVVADRMEAFGDDREALKNYGYLTAEAAALDMGEQGVSILLADGWRITVLPVEAAQ